MTLAQGVTIAVLGLVALGLIVLWKYINSVSK